MKDKTKNKPLKTKIIPDILGGDAEWCNIMHADGAGTKSSLAYLYWKEYSSRQTPILKYYFIQDSLL